MVIVSTKFLFLLGLCWMSKVEVTLGQSRDCTLIKQIRIPFGPFVVDPGFYIGGKTKRVRVPGWRCPSDPDICIPHGQEIKLGQDCRDCTTHLDGPGWRCNSGLCVWKGSVCDGYSDGYSNCSDGSDESPTICCASTCPSDPDICIPAGQEILPGQDCRDCTDNIGYTGWRCNSGQCMNKWKFCNGSPHCPDGSDEAPATCCASTCPSDPDICIPAGQEIKPGQDCRNCTAIYGHSGWRCNSGQCVEKWNVCNGSPQCSDGSDESPATCSPS